MEERWEGKQINRWSSYKSDQIRDMTGSVLVWMDVERMEQIRKVLVDCVVLSRKNTKVGILKVSHGVGILLTNLKV